MPQAIHLSGKLAVVTGASSGIGATTAHILAARGCQVLLLARNQERLADVVADIRSRGGEAHAFAADLADAQAIEHTARDIIIRHGIPDIVVNNAGAGRWLPLIETSAAEAAQMLAVPCLAAFNITREFLDGMLARGSGRIVNVTSVATRLSWPGATAYIAARRAMEGFDAGLRADLHNSGIGVMLAVFGTVDSAYWEHNPGSRERLPAPAALFRSLTPEAAALAIADGIERGRRNLVKPAAYRLVFLLNAAFPALSERMMYRSD